MENAWGFEGGENWLQFGSVQFSATEKHWTSMPRVLITRKYCKISTELVNMCTKKNEHIAAALKELISHWEERYINRHLWNKVGNFKIEVKRMIWEHGRETLRTTEMIPDLYLKREGWYLSQEWWESNCSHWEHYEWTYGRCVKKL